MADRAEQMREAAAGLVEALDDGDDHPDVTWSTLAREIRAMALPPEPERTGHADLLAEVEEEIRIREGASRGMGDSLPRMLMTVPPSVLKHIRRTLQSEPERTAEEWVACAAADQRALLRVARAAKAFRDWDAIGALLSGDEPHAEDAQNDLRELDAAIAAVARLLAAGVLLVGGPHRV